jgi:hypothetical protein
MTKSKEIIKEQSLTRELLADDEFRKIHDAWSLQNEALLMTHKDEWNFGIIIRNHTRDAFDLMLKRYGEMVKAEIIAEWKKLYYELGNPSLQMQALFKEGYNRALRVKINRLE